MNNEQEIRKAWRKEIERYPEMDALGSADWWLAKMSEEQKKLLSIGHTEGHCAETVTGIWRDIQKVITADRLALREKIEGMKMKCPNHNHGESPDEDREVVECYGYIEQHNQTISNILTLLDNQAAS